MNEAKDREMLELANEVKAGKTRSYVRAAQVFADYFLERESAETPSIVNVLGGIPEEVADQDVSRMEKSLNTALSFTAPEGQRAKIRTYLEGVYAVGAVRAREYGQTALEKVARELVEREATGGPIVPDERHAFVERMRVILGIEE